MSLALSGFVLGWSVAWPPGPVNTEAIRRGLARRFWPAYAVVIGACVGDALWALAVGLGAGQLLRVDGAQQVLGIVSIALLVVLATLFLRGAWRGLARLRAGETELQPSRFDSSRGSFALGFTLAITGPWNLAFWLAVVGQTNGAVRDASAALVLASGVLIGAATWGVILCAGVTRLGARFAKPSWHIVTQSATGLLMLFFAVRTALTLMGA